MKRWFALAAVTLGAGLASGLAWADSATEGERIKLPPDARLIGVEQVSEIRAFPELSNGQTSGGATNASKKAAPAAKVENVSASDSVYTTAKSFKESVSFLDKELESPELQPVVKTVTPSAVGYAVTLPSGKIAHVLVRNTKPTTIETLEAVSKTGDVKNEGEAPRSQSPSVPQ
jgi:hypothetical protein